MKKPLPIGYDNFREIISEGFYYVDKTGMIRELLDQRGKVNLITRPRRFGKTLALSMLRSYFERELDDSGCGIDNRVLFDGLEIMEAGEAYTDHMGRYPVINLSLKSAKQPTYEMAYAMIRRRIAEEYRRHACIREQISNAHDRERFEQMMCETADKGAYADALVFLSRILNTIYGQRVIILIDEYDVPLENAYFAGFYREMTDFIRSLFESALKTNEHLKFAVITGCLRISRESIFTDLNNLEVHSILSRGYEKWFGFTQPEVDAVLEYYGLEEKKTELKSWYDGYLFGDTEVYNPWSAVNYIKAAYGKRDTLPKPYWANTSSNSIIRELVEQADFAVKKEIEDLLEGKTIEKVAHEELTYEDIYKNQENLWNFLFFTGYLKKVTERLEGDSICLSLQIPNTEVRYIYRNMILDWFERKVGQTDLRLFYRAVLEGDEQRFSDVVSEQLADTISFFDYAENYYHGFLCGLLKGCPGYLVLSNRESGIGRADIILKTPSARGMAIIMELKVVHDFEGMEAGCDAALSQIRERGYEADLYKEGYRKLLTYGVCFYRKECLVKKGDWV